VAVRKENEAEFSERARARFPVPRNVVG